MCRTTRLRPYSASLLCRSSLGCEGWKTRQGYGGQASLERGNRREEVFFEDADRRRYLLLMFEYCRVHALEISAYCLMTNHVRFVAVPREPDALAATLSTERKHGYRPQVSQTPIRVRGTRDFIQFAAMPLAHVNGAVSVPKHAHCPSGTCVAGTRFPAGRG